MTEPKMSWREKQDAARAAEQEALWGMPIAEFAEIDPVATARDAFAAGHRTLQLDLPIAWIQGAIGVGQMTSRYRRVPSGDLIGFIEAEGWRFEQVSTTYVGQGSSATKRIAAHDGSTLVAQHGVVMALYIFRRVD